jgi:ABC-type lipoprotein release transport system permease subunit
LSVRFGGRLTDGFVDRFRTLAAEVDPALQVRRAGPLAQFYGEVRSLWRYVAWGIGVLTASVLLLSAAGIYALMSFTVAQRTREIGIRAALGAHPRRILLNVFSRVTGQLGIGVAVGSLVSGVVFAAMGLSAADVTVLLVTVAGIMLIVGLLAAFGPARRGLKIDASEALRAEA